MYILLLRTTWRLQIPKAAFGPRWVRFDTSHLSFRYYIFYFTHSSFSYFFFLIYFITISFHLFLTLNRWLIIQQDDVRAVFHKQTSKLTLTSPVVPVVNEAAAVTKVLEPLGSSNHISTLPLLPHFNVTELTTFQRYYSNHCLVCSPHPASFFAPVPTKGLNPYLIPKYIPYP